MRLVSSLVMSDYVPIPAGLTRRYRINSHFRGGERYDAVKLNREGEAAILDSVGFPSLSEYCQKITMTSDNPHDSIINPSQSLDNHRQSPDITGSELRPYVRYARTGDDGNPRQLHRLHHIDEPVPVDADFASPVYLLEESQIKRHRERKAEDDLFRVNDQTSIAIALQDECEEVDRVRYPLFIESDADIEFFKMRAELKRFISDVFEVNPNDGRGYFSGGRSLHIHLPYYVGSHTGLQGIRNKVEAFNEESDALIDPSNYSRKSLFRLPGAKHHNTGIRKLSVALDSSDEQLQKEIARAVAGRREEELVLPSTEIGDFLRFCVSQPLELGQSVPVPVVEQEEQPTMEANRARWKQYNRHPFSPYANTGNERRSVVVAQVKGNPYCRDTEAGGDIRQGIFVPAYIYGAVSADGEYLMWRENGRIRLSKIDYGKWNSGRGDTIVLLGGQSRGSRIIELDDSMEREWLMDLLVHDSKRVDNDSDGRREVIDTLRMFGYDVGSAGKNGPYRHQSGWSGGGGERSSSRASQLQKQAERNDVEILTHREQLHVTNRLLALRGWNGADEWFREQYGDNYDREITHKHLRSVVEKYDDLSR